jgi:hypothetical protein
MDAVIIQDIRERLDEICADQAVRIPLAIESGSRAWGFPSPDSDYDARFIFVRRTDDYLALHPPRDVIETPVGPIFDINGWDLRKALLLMLKGNAVVLEWLTSPFAYRVDPAFRADFLALAERAADRDAVIRHYYHLALATRRQYGADLGAIRLKKLFYMLRPLVARSWLESHPARTVAPMHFPTLVEEAPLSCALRQEIAELQTLKAETREMGDGATPVLIRAFIEAEFAREPRGEAGRRAHEDDRLAEADHFFRLSLSRLWA